jgi:Fe-S cluster assembly protein SufB
VSDSVFQNRINKPYSFGFQTDTDSYIHPAGLSVDVIQYISSQKSEPNWMLDFRLKAYNAWCQMSEPHWSHIDYPPIDYDEISYFATHKKSIDSLDDVDPEILKTFARLGIPLQEQKILSGVAVDAVLDSSSVRTTYQTQLSQLGIIFCPMSEAILKYSDLVRKYLGSVVPPRDNFFACLNSAVFSDGTFVYLPSHTACPIDLSTYFRINAIGTGQFERTLIICEDHSSVSYLEGCTAPQRDENQLHAAVVELVAMERAKIHYSTVQNWYPGDKHGKGGIYNFVTKRGICKGNHSNISWTQLETGSSKTWKYPSVILKGNHSAGEFYSVTLTNNYQQTDTGTKMTHLGKETSSRIISKSISAGNSQNTFRSKVLIGNNATESRNFTVCDSLILGTNAQAHTIPTIIQNNSTSTTQHEASSSTLSTEHLMYLQSRGLNEEQASQLIISGFCKEILQRLPMEFAIEARNLIELQIENSIG